MATFPFNWLVCVWVEVRPIKSYECQIVEKVSLLCPLMNSHTKFNILICFPLALEVVQGQNELETMWLGIYWTIKWWNTNNWLPQVIEALVMWSRLNNAATCFFWASCYWAFDFSKLISCPRPNNSDNHSYNSFASSHHPRMKHLESQTLASKAHSWWAVWLILCTTCHTHCSTLRVQW